MRDSESYFRVLRLRPGNFGWTRITMLLLHPDLSMRGFRTAWLINKFDECYSGCQRIKNYLPSFAAPNFDNIRLHRVVFKISWANGNLHPRDGNFVRSFIALCA